MAAFLDPLIVTPSPSIAESNVGTSPRSIVRHYVDSASSNTHTAQPPDYHIPLPSEPVDVAGFNLLMLEPVISRGTSQPQQTNTSNHNLSFRAIRLSNSGARTALRARYIPDNPPLDDQMSISCSCQGMSNNVDLSSVDGLGLSDPWTKIQEGQTRLGEILTKHQGSVTSNDVSSGGDLKKIEMELVDDMIDLLG